MAPNPYVEIKPHKSYQERFPKKENKLLSLSQNWSQNWLANDYIEEFKYEHGKIDPQTLLDIMRENGVYDSLKIAGYATFDVIVYQLMLNKFDEDHDGMLNWEEYKAFFLWLGTDEYYSDMNELKTKAKAKAETMAEAMVEAKAELKGMAPNPNVEIKPHKLYQERFPKKENSLLSLSQKTYNGYFRGYLNGTFVSDDSSTSTTSYGSSGYGSGSYGYNSYGSEGYGSSSYNSYGSAGYGSGSYGYNSYDAYGHNGYGSDSYGSYGSSGYNSYGSYGSSGYNSYGY